MNKIWELKTKKLMAGVGQNKTFKNLINLEILQR